MKFVYVLVSSEEDYYAEEAFVSMYSLRRYNNDAEITLVADNLTDESLKGNRARIKDFVDEYIVSPLPANLTPVQRSRYQKTSLRELVKGDFLYIDNDTVITDLISEEEFGKCDIGAVLNQHIVDFPARKHSMMQTYKKQTGQCNEDYFNIRQLFNGGVIYAKDNESAHEFFKKWHELWWHDCCQHNFQKDQVAMWRANALCGHIITPISGVFNCQLPYPLYCLKYLDDAKILHYFSSLDFISITIRRKDKLKYIRENGIDEVIKKNILDVREEYRKDLTVFMGSDAQYYVAPLTIAALKLSKTFPFINKILERVIKICYR